MRKLMKPFVAIAFVLTVVFSANAQSASTKTAFTREEAIQQPLYTEYKGVRLGMLADDVRAKLGAPALKSSEQDYYVFSDNETAQIGYDVTRKVVTISVDYVNGIGAPDYKAVVGVELERMSNGSMYKVVRYEQLRFWVSYSRTSGALPIVTVTIQKF
jgi:outer membrane protein assembly factor BamE (lipoprotein component of BamABCDE complex)